MPESALPLIAPDAVQIETLRFEPNNLIPNNPKLPVMLLRGVLQGPHPDSEIHELYRQNFWGGVWTWSVYDFHHYHSNAHEALAVACGQARLMLGGPEGQEIPVGAGDLVVLPAGTGHKRLDSSPDFAVCGAYPKGQEDPDLLRATEENWDGTAARIASVPLPQTDPFYGTDGPLVRLWSG